MSEMLVAVAFGFVWLLLTLGVFGGVAYLGSRTAADAGRAEEAIEASRYVAHRSDDALSLHTRDVTAAKLERLAAPDRELTVPPDAVTRT